MALVIPGADFFRGPPLSDFTLFDVMDTNPVKNNLLGSYFLGKKNADPTYNFANPALPLLVRGEPNNEDARFARLGKNIGYYDTQIPSAQSQTIVALCRQPAVGVNSVLIANYQKDASNVVTGDTLVKGWNSTNSRFTFYAQKSAGIDNAFRDDGVNALEFNVVGGLITASGATIGAWSMNESTYPGYTPKLGGARTFASRSLLIGATYSTTEFLTSIDISSVLIYAGDIGPEKMADVMNWLRNEVGVESGIWAEPKPE